MIVFEAIKEVNGRTNEKQLAETLDLAKVQARNWVRLDGEPEWVDESPRLGLEGRTKETRIEERTHRRRSDYQTTWIENKE